MLAIAVIIYKLYSVLHVEASRSDSLENTESDWSKRESLILQDWKDLCNTGFIYPEPEI